MGRKKIEIEIIKDEKKRASTFDKRRIGLFKKASELNRLCGVNISVVIIKNESVYRFRNVSNSNFENYHNHNNEKLEEDFNNESLLEYLNKKPIKSANNIDTNSIDNQSTNEEFNNDLTDDEDEIGFFSELKKTNLLQQYENIQPEISPIKERNELYAIDYQKNKDKITGTAAQNPFHFAIDKQIYNESIKGTPSASRINQIQIIHQQIPDDDESEFISQSESSFFSDLNSITTTDSIFYNLQNSLKVPTNNLSQEAYDPCLEKYKCIHPQQFELNFDNNLKYNNPSNSLETPTFESFSNNNNHPMHLNHTLSSFYRHRPDEPSFKRPRVSTDSNETLYLEDKHS